MANLVYIACSLDGYIADSNHGIEWLDKIPVPENDDLGFSQFMKNIDALVMGKNTYKTLTGFDQWPYTVPIFVASNSLVKVEPKKGHQVKLVRGNPVEISAQLEDLGFKNLYVDGGRTIQGFLEVDLIDEMIITVIPQLLGDGIPLFAKPGKPLSFITYKTELLSIGATKMYLRRVRN